MASKTKRGRPVSPHLQVYKWEPHMLVSILHRVSGDVLAIIGSLLFLWWLGAIASGEESYEVFLQYVWHGSDSDTFQRTTNILGRITLIGLTWAFFQHFFSGLRHFVLDTGAGYELKINRIWSVLVVAGALLATVAIWLPIYMGVV